MLARNLILKTLNHQLNTTKLSAPSLHHRLYSTLNQDDDFSIVSAGVAGQSDLPLLIDRQLKHPEMFNPKITPPREVWVEDFTNSNQLKLAIVKLHPKIFAQFPRPDTVKRNLDWQNDIHWVNYISLPTKNEMSGSTKKPWQQKGTGRARHGSKRGPQWKNGAWINGPRGDLTHTFVFY